jgi:hypothetical protein
MKTSKLLKQVVYAAFLAVFMLGLAAPSAVFADDGTPAPEAPAPVEEAPAVEPAPELPAVEAPAETPASEPAPDAPQPEDVQAVVQALPENVNLVVFNEHGDQVPLGSQAAAEVLSGGDPMWCPLSVLPGGAGCTTASTSFLAEDGLLSKLTGKTGNGTIYVAWNYSSLNESDYNHGILLDYTNDNRLTGLGNLTIQGGWDFDTNQMYAGGEGAPRSVFNFGTGYFAITGWTHEVNINDISLQDTTGGYLNGTGSLAVFNPTTGGDVNLKDVTTVLSGQHAVVGVNNETAAVYIETKGDVTVTDSQFDRSKSTGLVVASKGDVMLEGVEAISNEGIGVWVDNCIYAEGSGCSAQGSVTLAGTNTFGFGFTNEWQGQDFGNWETGLYVQTGGKVSSAAGTTLSANGNGWNGVEIWRGDSDTSEVIELLGTNNFNYNDNSGLEIYANGPITLHSITANNNSAYGTYIRGLFELDPEMEEWSAAAAGVGGTLTISGMNNFNGNGDSGLEAYVDGKITASNLNAIGNSGLFGALLSTCPGFYEEDEYTFICYNDPAYDPDKTYEFIKEGVDYDVTISGNNVFGGYDEGEFLGNDGTGLMVQTYGDIKLGTASSDSVTAQNNSLFGTWLQSGVFQSTYDYDGDSWFIDDYDTTIGGGNVTLMGIHLYGGFDDDHEDNLGNYYSGLEIEARSADPDNGNVTLENEIEASYNGDYGIRIYGTGFVDVSGEAKFFNGNEGAGLLVTNSNGAKIANVTSTDNGGDGVNINDAYGDVEVTDVTSIGNDNEGLDAYYFYDGAKLTLTSISANMNGGNGIWVGEDEDMGAVVVSQCVANENTYEGMWFEYMPSLTISNSEASFNGQDEASDGIVIYLEGKVTLNTVTANNNGADGISADTGTATCKNIVASENQGSGMVIYSAGDIKISGANEFNLNGESGFIPEGEGDIDISNVQANDNVEYGIWTGVGGNGKITLTGVEANRNYSGICISTIGGNILVKNSEASQNENYGLNIFDRINIGDSIISCSSFNENGTNGFRINGIADVYLWGVEANDNGDDPFTLSIKGSLFESDSCTGGCVCEPGDAEELPGLPGVVVPVVGGENVTLECGRAWTMLQLGNLDATKFSGLCGSEMGATLSGMTAEGLPAPLPEGMTLGSGMTAGINGSSVLPGGGTVRVSFVVPAELQGKSLSILFWDAAAGAWVKLPLFGEVGFAGSDAAMQVLSGVQVNADGTVSVTVNFGGTFVLVGE